MGTFSIWHWLVVLAIVVLVFGTKKLRSLGGDLGGAIKGFKEGMKGADDEVAAKPPASPPPSQQITTQSSEHVIKEKNQTNV